ncbi:hypothetical protein [Alkalicoccobacillus porphyridii]|uniref:MFS transporter n=1 Tax=Alkalicoccobacillus porphyridii TaxID=2597270 RepID=A0A554A410_9BACI|nr:hypothetical protein [Alkalicoccobacillus porphyridii]TSB48421.1 hypothetical protein FN960_02380 [Alkalicoccobacillus porphyridii]
MIEKMIRSPITQLFCVGMLMIWFYVLAKPFPTLVPIVLVILVGFLIAFLILMFIHNKRNPNRKVRFFTMTPYELLEDDEGQQWVTNRACRKVYVMYWYAIPLMGALMVSFPYFPEVPLILLFILAIIQYSIMYIEIKRYLN